MNPQLWTWLADEVDRLTDSIRDIPVSPSVTPEEIRSELEHWAPFKAPSSLDEVLARSADLLRRWTVHITHPRYFGLFNPSVIPAAILADALVALYNPQLAAWSHAPAANEIEQYTLRHLATLLGFDATDLIANFTSGGAEANLSAVLTAIAHHFPEAGEKGLFGIQQRPVIYLTGESHHSFVKIARMSGLGTEILREVPVTNRFVIDSRVLRNMIRSDRETGWYPLLIIGNAGTTSAGMVDPLDDLADLARESGAWFHIDGAWGATAALSTRLRPVLRGIERADSVTWDAHKWLSVPMGAGMFFCRHPDAVKRAFTVSTTYMPTQTGNNILDPYTSTAQWSRRMIGLKLFVALAERGVDGYADLIEHQTRMGDLLRDALSRANWEIVNDTLLPVICFTHPDIRAGKISIAQILTRIYERGKVWISAVVLGKREQVLRACITSFRTGEVDLECLMEELERARQA